MRHFALLGASLSHSFSQKYFEEKFEKNAINADYFNLELDSISKIRETVFEKKLSGFNVTIPFKKEILHYCDKISAAAKDIGAANCVKVSDKELIAHNTDYIAFRETLEGHELKTAIVLGTGGASRAVCYSLKEQKISFKTVSRSPEGDSISYSELHKMKDNFDLLVNCTPLGTFPKISESPDIPNEQLGSFKFVYDLVYNPALTELLKRAQAMGAQIKNGEEMLHLQAERSWKIWNNELEEL